VSETEFAACFPGDITNHTTAPREPRGGFVTSAYLRGTRIETPGGGKLIEDLAIGDQVITCFGGLQRIKWIGRQRFDGAEPGCQHRPIRFRPDALGEGMPARDLFVAPGQAIMVGHALVAADALVNGVTITQDECPARVEYFQLDLGQHDCVVAAGAWAETLAYAPGQRDAFDNAAEFEELYPHEPPPAYRSCAPQTDHGAALYAALWPVVARAGAGLAPGTLRGFVDLIEDERVLHGWAQDLDHPELPVCLDILLGARVIGTVLACDFREDLHQEGIGPCSFVFNAPIALRRALWPTLQVRRRADDAALDVAATIRGDTPRADLRLVA
jgi:hypothetical protein